MNKTSTLNIRVDEKTHRELKKFAEHIGIPASSLVNASIRQMLRTREAVFSASLKPTAYLEGLIKEAETDWRAGRRNIEGPFKSADEMIAALGLEE
ncbi:MAG: hypothetical protein AAB634_02585 [Patescibacteria group bacterium]